MPPTGGAATEGAGAGAGTGAAAGAAGAGAYPIRAQQSTSSSQLQSQFQLQSGGQRATGRLPRSSSLHPSPATLASSHLNLSKPLPSPHGPAATLPFPPDSRQPETTSRNEHHPHHLNRHHDEARPSQPDRLHPFNNLPEGHRVSSHWVNRWSASTNSSHGHSASLSRSPPPPSSPTTTRRASSVDITFFLAGSPPSTGLASRTLRRSRTPSESHEYLASLGAGGYSPAANHHDDRGNLRPATPDSPARRARERDRYPPYDFSEPPEEQTGQYEPASGQAGDFTSSPSRPRARAATAESAAMQYESGQEYHYAHHGHSRNRSGKSSGDSSKYRGGKPPSQKAMLSHALQKANAAVQLDNSQDFIAARSAYTEACSLLEQVLQRTTAQDDQRKLEAIRRTYTSRIDELDQMMPFQGKELPAFPDEDSIHRQTIIYPGQRDEEDEPVVATATVTRIIREDDPDGDYYYQHSTNPSQRWQQDPLPPSRSPPLPPIQPPEPGFLQSSFSKSPIRSRFPANAMQSPPESSYGSSHIAFLPTHQQSNSRDDDLDGPVRTDFSVSSRSRAETRRKPEHHRDDSQNSWLDPIDESGGSTESSVHSRTSSFGYRRRHIRAGSGNTENEFDNALDAAIEAAYDDGYEPMEAPDYNRRDSDDVAVADVLRRVEMARERVRQTEREAYDVANEQERQRLQLQRHQQQQQVHESLPPSLPADDLNGHLSDDDVEQMLEEMRVYTNQDYYQYGQGSQQKRQQQPSVPRESDSSGLTTSTWNSSTASNALTNTTTLSTVTESAPTSIMTQGPAPAPPPTGALPDLPPPRPSSAQSKSVRNRRSLSQNHKQLKIETTKIAPAVPRIDEDSAQPKSTASARGLQSSIEPPKSSIAAFRRPVSPPPEASPTDTRPLGSPFGHRSTPDVDDNAGRSTSPSVSRLKKNFSSSSLKSLKGRAMSISNIDEGDMSPGTPSSAHFNSSRPPAVPAIPTPLTASLRDRADTATGGMYLLDADFQSPATLSSPSQIISDAPVPLEPCPTDTMLRPFWLMRCLYQTLVHPRGGFVSTKLFVPREAWRVKNVKLKNIDEKVAQCDYLTAALLKLAKVDTCDADAMLEEMQSLEGVLEQVQAALSRRLGNEVGVQGIGILFKDAATPTDGDSTSSMPRTASVSGKSSAFSWRRLRSKNSAAALGNSSAPRVGVDTSKDTLSSLPMTAQPTSRPPKRSVGHAHFEGPNAQYMGSLARLFDAAQVVDQIARQVDDPGLRHADKTQVGLELCTRHAAEFFAFYICRFVLADIGLLMDKFIKRGTEWVLT